MGSGVLVLARAEITMKYAGGVCQGVEEGQREDTGRGVRGDRLESG